MNNASDTHSSDKIRDDNKHDETKDPERLEREVDQARARLGKTASELSDRLSPGELMDQALGMVREHGGEFGRNLGAQVKSNPMPMILTSIGISWMMVSSGNNGNNNSTATYGTTGVNGMTGAKNSARGKAAAVGDHVHDVNANARETAQNARDGLARFYRDQPLIAGCLGVAIGAALGTLVPSTRIEDNIMGEASDRSVDAAKSTAENEYDKVREPARSA